MTTYTCPVPAGQPGQTICDPINAYDWRGHAWHERGVHPEIARQVIPGERLTPWWRWARHCEPIAPVPQPVTRHKITHIDAAAFRPVTPTEPVTPTAKPDAPDMSAWTDFNRWREHWTAHGWGPYAIRVCPRRGAEAWGRTADGRRIRRYGRDYDELMIRTAIACGCTP